MKSDFEKIIDRAIKAADKRKAEIEQMGVEGHISTEDAADLSDAFRSVYVELFHALNHFEGIQARLENL